MTRTVHSHHCGNRTLGCQTTYTCSLGPVEDDCGRYCPANPTDSLLCAECEESQCEVCGRYLAIQGHEADCDGATGV